MSGLTLPAGGETHWSYTVRTRHLTAPGFQNEAAAWAQLAKWKAAPNAPKVQIVRQSVTQWPDGRYYRSPYEHVGGDVDV